MRIYAAIQLAIQAHNKQIRKLDGDLYVAHPLEVGFMLAQEGLSEDVIIAGILHDTVEDTSVTLADIASQFGDPVARLVEACSEEDKTLPWQTRKEAMLRLMCNGLPRDIKMILLADKVSNLSSIQRNLARMGPGLWACFNAGYDQQKWYFTEICKCMTDMKDTHFYEELCRLVNEVFGTGTVDIQV